jgi:hypothetical protein
MPRNRRETKPTHEESIEDIDSPRMMPERSIRDIGPSQSRVRLQRHSATRQTPPVRERHQAAPKRGRWGVWLAAGISLIILGGAAALILFPSTSVTITPHTQVVPFDSSTSFTAYPEGSAAPNTISYSVVSQVFEDSTVVAANGIEKVDEKATGSVTVYNEYSDKPVRLIKNTRFQAANGLIYRIPASVDVPGKTAAGPGTIQVTIFADQTGDSYNLPPQDKLTLPGLKSTAEMYNGVYARSSAPFTGGFSGDRPAVAPATLDAARSEVRGRLNEKALQLAATAPEGSLAFPGLVSISFESLAPTQESGGGVRIHEKATVVMPVFPSGAFAQAIGQAVSASAEGEALDIRFSPNMTGSASTTLALGEMGQKPLIFSLSGTGQLIWKVDGPALAQALAGKEESSFQPIIQGFPAVEEARARITPFWQQSFPQDPAKIQIEIQDPPQPF